MRAALVLALVTAGPALAEGRSEPVLSCDFAGEKLTLTRNGASYGLAIGNQTFPAALARPGPDGRVVAVFSMLDAGPVMIAVATSDPAAGGDPVHASEITASRLGGTGLATRTTGGTCTEATR